MNSILTLFETHSQTALTSAWCLQVFLVIVLAITYYLVDYITNWRLEQVEKRRMRSEQQARSRQLARERWHRSGRKIIDTIRKKNKELGITRPTTTGSRPGSSCKCGGL